ncbi:MAG: 16S rRNA (adenine(1518)-N(6)/adenine(1519)-N(6))-dimethyltransferase RsmA [Clostridiales bacterium]|jgi:16S rRNA (adenine1518-N6/adenine1519-N6)-dimethyltransferase|nr:16S rRNA (adenine(1518)-N(6)/adenine(1519)-N(6))-dimethyltransferase RsmA [Clostridiales bacterium]
MKLKKNLSQNLLINKNIIKTIVKSLEIKEKDIIIEIGSGLGALTEFLFNAKKVISIEIDNNFCKILNNKFMQKSNFELINKDFLKLNFLDIIKNFNADNIKVISNLPYHISTSIITKCLVNLNKLNRIIFMMQSEFAERLLSKPSKKTYGSITLFANYYSKMYQITDVSADCFNPKPKVDSKVIKFTYNNNFIDKCHEKIFFEIIKLSFSKRRKTILNCLNGFKNNDKKSIENILESINLDKNIRGEDLSIDNFKKFAGFFVN